MLQNAEQLLRAGRNSTLRRWIACLPEQFRVGRPWLHLWLGRLHLPQNPVEGETELVVAWNRFREVGDRTGALLAWAGLTESLNYRQSFVGVKDLIVALEEFLGDAPVFPSEQLEAIVVCTLVNKLWIGWHDHPNREHLERRAEQLAAYLPLALQVIFLSHCVSNFVSAGQHARAAVLVEELRALSSRPDATPMTQLTTLTAYIPHFARCALWSFSGARDFGAMRLSAVG